MSSNPVTRTFFTRDVLGFAIVDAMELDGGAGAGGWTPATPGVPGATVIGTLLGALGALFAIGGWYHRYDGSFDDD